MRNFKFLSLSFTLALAAVSLAGQSEKPNLSGTWQMDAAKSDNKSGKIVDATWVIEESDNSIHLTQSEGAGRTKKLELKCSTDGKECSVSGEKAKASFWYNGPMLVEMETRGDHVTRYRLKLSPDGKTLSVEVTELVPASDKSDNLVFAKSST